MGISYSVSVRVIKSGMIVLLFCLALVSPLLSVPLENVLQERFFGLFRPDCSRPVFAPFGIYNPCPETTAVPTAAPTTAAPTTATACIASGADCDGTSTCCSGTCGPNLVTLVGTICQ